MAKRPNFLFFITDQHGRKAVAAITVADLKNRFLRHLDGVISELASDGTDEVVF